jgi:hypothetical protein
VLQAAAITVDDIALRPPRLDEAFLELTGHDLQDSSGDGRVTDLGNTNSPDSITA